MAEWLKAHAWKACLGETLTWVRIPLSPPFLFASINLIFSNWISFWLPFMPSYSMRNIVLGRSRVCWQDRSDLKAAETAERAINNTQSLFLSYRLSEAPSLRIVC